MGFVRGACNVVGVVRARAGFRRPVAFLDPEEDACAHCIPCASSYTAIARPPTVRLSTNFASREVFSLTIASCHLPFE